MELAYSTWWLPIWCGRACLTVVYGFFQSRESQHELFRPGQLYVASRDHCRDRRVAHREATAFTTKRGVAVM